MLASDTGRRWAGSHESDSPIAALILHHHRDYFIQMEGRNKGDGSPIPTPTKKRGRSFFCFFLFIFFHPTWTPGRTKGTLD